MATPLILTISGHDPSGGAGIQADIEAIVAAGCRAASAITCLTVQDTAAVHRLVASSPQLLDEQIRTLLADMRVDALKVGLIPDLAILGVISAVADDHPEIPVILDPVLTSGNGTELTEGALLDALTRELLPKAALVTPNSIEARRLSGTQGLEDSAHTLLACGCRAVLITGTHESGPEVFNRLYQSGLPTISSSWPRLPGSYHGSGCTLASSTAAHMAKGSSLAEAVSEALEYTWNTLFHAGRPGKGQSVPDRFFALRKDEASS